MRTTDTQIIATQHPAQSAEARDIGIETPEKPTDVTSSNIEDEDELVPHLHMKTYLTVFAICLIYFAQLVNVVGAGARAQDIGALLGGSAESVWLTSPSTMFTCILGPPLSQAADYWGRRHILIVTTVFGAVGSIIVARASSMNMAIAGQCVIGLSYAAQPLLHVVTSEVLPRRYRPWAQAADNVAVSLGGFIGLVVGGAMARNGYHVGFRNFWYLTTGLFALAALLCFVLYKPPARALQLSLTNVEKFKRLDWVGYFLLASGLVLFCVGLSWSQNPYQWTDPHILATFLIGIVLLAIFAVYEVKYIKDGIFHHALFSQGWNYNIALLCVATEALSFFAANNYFVLQIIIFTESDSLLSGVRYSITFIVYGLSSILTGVFCSTTKKIRIPAVVAYVSMTIFFICMATTTPNTDDPTWGYPVFLGIGLGACLCSIVTAAQLSTPPELIAIASGLLIAVRGLGGAIALAVYNAIYTGTYSSKLSPKIAEAVLPLGLPASSLAEFIAALSASNTTALALVPDVNTEIITAGTNGMLRAYNVAFRYVWITAGCFTALAAIAAAFLVDPVEEFNMRIDAPAEKDEDLFSRK